MTLHPSWPPRRTTWKNSGTAASRRTRRWGRMWPMGWSCPRWASASTLWLSDSNRIYISLHRHSSQHHTLHVQQAGLFLRRVIGAGEDVPEPEGLIPRAGDDGAAIGTHGQVQHPEGVPGQSGDLLHGGVLPDVDFVERIPVGADDLVHALAEHQAAHLRVRIHHLAGRALQGVPEPQGSILSSASWDQQSVLMRWPGHCFHSCLMVTEFQDRWTWVLVPD